MTLLPDDLVELQEVSDLTTGTYLVTTYSGTQHTIDLDNKTWVRQGCAGHEWKAGGKYLDITPDGEVFCFTSTTGIKVGASIYATDGEEFRITSTVRKIEKIS